MKNRRVLVIDIGGTNVKFVATGLKAARKFPSGPTMTPRRIVAKIKEQTADWKYEVISIGYPGVVKNNWVVVKPKNLGPGWVGFDFSKALGRPVKLINDAALQPDDVVLGGGAKHLKKLPKSCRLGDSSHAFLGGFRLWQDLPRR